MILLNGKYNSAKVYTNNIEKTAISQIIKLCNQPFISGSKIRIMPDTHAGAGATIGTTMTIENKEIVPNLVGVDIGCGMHVCRLKNKMIDLKQLDKVIHESIPCGFNIRETEHKYIEKISLNELRCKEIVNMQRAGLSLGTIGGGNHFCEIDKDDEDNLYLVIHTGSRYLGKQVAEYYQELGYKTLSSLKNKKIDIVHLLKSQGREKEIELELKRLQPIKINKDLAYVEGENFDDYIHDMKIVQLYAHYNRKAIAKEITTNMGFEVTEEFATIHNYIDTENMILRKGAISAQKGEKVIIPMNMRDGSIIAIGKGNEDWNYSAPHGAGRLFSRSKAKEKITLEEFKESMEGIYTTSVCESTIDESPMAYKPIDEIIDNIQDTVEIQKIIKPIYNFKSN